MSAKIAVGDLEWRLIVDTTQLNKGLSEASTKLKKQEKEIGGVLGFLTSKWGIMAGVATGAAYAMIRASPSLSFAMEEVQYRFEYLFQVIGEQFAPILNDVLLPALDNLIPLVEEAAPAIGEMVENAITALSPLSPEFDRVTGLVGDSLERLFTKAKDPKYETMFEDVVTSLGGIASSILDVVEPAVDGFWDLLELFEPFITTTFTVALEGVNDVLGLLSGFITGVVTEIKGDEKIMGVFQQFSDILNDDVIPAIETLGDWLEDLITWLEESGRLSIAINNTVMLIGGVATVFGLAADEIDRTIIKLEIIYGWLEKINWGKVLQFVQIANPFGAPYLPESEPIELEPIALLPMPVYPKGISTYGVGGDGGGGGGGGGTNTGGVVVNINIPEINVSSDYDVARLVEKISQELKRELGLFM